MHCEDDVARGRMRRRRAKVGNVGRGQPERLQCHQQRFAVHVLVQQRELEEIAVGVARELAQRFERAFERVGHVGADSRG